MFRRAEHPRICQTHAGGLATFIYRFPYATDTAPLPPTDKASLPPTDNASIPLTIQRFQNGTIPAGTRFANSAIDLFKNSRTVRAMLKRQYQHNWSEEEKKPAKVAVTSSNYQPFTTL